MKNSRKNIREESKDAEDKYADDIKRLWAIIKRAQPDKRSKIIADLDKKTIMALRTLNNPYKKPIIEGDRYRYLAFNVINLTEKYSRRFAMTSLIGFIYRMLDEYKSKSSEYISENDPQFANLYNSTVKELILNKPEEKLIQELNAVKNKIDERSKNTSNNKDLREIVKESYTIRAKLLKYKTYLLKDENKTIKTKHEGLSKDIKNHESQIKVLENNLSILKIKLEKKIKYNNTKLEKMTKTSNKDNIEIQVEPLDKDNIEIQVEPLDKDNIEIQVEPLDKDKTPKVGLTFKEGNNMPVRDFKINIDNTEKVILKLTDELKNKTESFQEVDQLYNMSNNKIESYNQKFKELKEEYSHKLKYKGKVHPLDTVEIDRYEPQENELDDIAQLVKNKLNIKVTEEEHTEEIQNIIQEFLDQYLRYNPDNHVRCAYKPNYDDPSRKPLEIDEQNNIVEETYERSIIPPDDTFFRLDRYVENNYEPLRQATDDIYCEKSDFEFDLVPLEVFEGDSQEDAEEKFNQYKRKYADEFESDIFSARFANHNLLSPWYQNREVRDFYTERTEIIKRILEQNKEDARMGQKLMKDRAKQKKDDDIKKMGPDPASHKQYLAANPPSELKKHGAVHIDEIESGNIIKEKHIPRDRDDSSKDEIEVGVHVIKPQRSSGKRRIRGFSEQWKFNIPSEPLKEGAAKIQTPSEFQSKLIKQEQNL